MPALQSLIERWPAPQVAAAVIADGATDCAGERDRVFPLASLTKLITAMAALIAVEEGTLAYDSEVITGAPLIDVLAHCSGLAPDQPRLIARPRARRIYSTSGYDLIAETLARESSFTFGSYVHEAIFSPLEMATARADRGGTGGHASLEDVAALARELTVPTLLSAETHRQMTQPHIAGLPGVLPGFGFQADNAWGLGPEVRDGKRPHWTGSANSSATYGHFGRDGSFVWVDPLARCALVVLTDRAFGPWAAEAWPRLADAVLER